MSDKPIKAHCPNCDDERSCDLHGSTQTSWDWESDDGHHSVNGGGDHRLLQCRGCETVFYEKSTWNSEEWDYWYGSEGETLGRPSRTVTTYPKPDSMTKPAWVSAVAKIDGQLGDILDETYVAYDNRSFILTSVGLRTALDRATEVLKIDSGKTFSQKLTDLQNGGWIGETEKQVLEVVVDAGNAAAHRAWSPDAHEVAQLVSAMEIFLQKAFIVGKKALSLKATIPTKAPRPKSRTVQ